MHSRAPSRKRRLGTALAGLAVLAPIATIPAITASADDEATGDRQQVYADAADEFGVPESVLLGVSYLESRWDSNSGLPSTGGGYGPMHLTDAEYVATLGSGHHDGDEDPRGDESRPFEAPDVDEPIPDDEGLQTLDLAADLTGSSEEDLRTDAGANIHGGAAVLAHYQEEIGAPTGADSDPADWYGAVAKYSGGDSLDAAEAFADEVYTEMAAGVTRAIDDGDTVALEGDSGLKPHKDWTDHLGLDRLERPDGLECPIGISCEWLPAPYELRGDGTNKYSYGNHDKHNRPKEQKIEYIVIHDGEGYFDGITSLAQNKNWVSWHYTLRSSDGHIAQHLKAKDAGWHAGNWYVNAKSIGLEHEGFAASGAWYTEAMYRTSAKLVRYLALRLNIPLDRQHIIGHDNVPGILPDYVRGMHWDPGPYWDWGHYMELLKNPIEKRGNDRSGMVIMNPDFENNKPEFYGCENSPPDDDPCTPKGSSSVILYSEPSFDSDLVVDVGLHPDGSPSTMYISDHGARASAGQTYAVADREGDWTAIWYLGQKAWFYNPDRSAAVPTVGFVVTPKYGKETIPVYGRAYPDPEAYPEGVPVQTIGPLQYTLSAGERYAFGGIYKGEYYRAVSYDHSDPGDGTVIRGDNRYVQIQFGHRIMFVNLDDVYILPGMVGAP
jgi:hypothetical protein